MHASAVLEEVVEVALVAGCGGGAGDAVFGAFCACGSGFVVVVALITGRTLTKALASSTTSLTLLTNPQVPVLISITRALLHTPTLLIHKQRIPTLIALPLTRTLHTSLCTFHTLLRITQIPPHTTA